MPTLTSLKRLSDYGVKWRSFQEPYIDTTTGFGDVIAALAAPAKSNRKEAADNAHPAKTLFIVLPSCRVRREQGGACFDNRESRVWR